MFLHVCFWQFDTDRKDTNGNDDPCDFESDLFADVTGSSSPVFGIEEIGGIGSNDDANDRGNYGLTDVEALLDDEGEHAELFVSD